MQPEIEQLLGSFQKPVQGGSRARPIIEELTLQMQIVQRLSNVISRDLSEARQASQNYLLTSTHIKQVAKLLASNACPESWATDFTAAPCSMAPPESPELLTLRSGTVKDFLELLPKSLRAMIEGVQQCAECENTLKPIQLKPELYPRP